MAYQLFQLPKAVQIDTSVRVVPGAKAYFYETLTSTPQDTFTTAALNVAHQNPVEADANGVFPPIYLDPALRYKLTLTTAADVLIYTQDPVNDQVLSQAIIGGHLYPVTDAELTEAVTIVNAHYPPYWVPRYGDNGGGDCHDIIQAAISAAEIADTVAYLPATFGEARISSPLAITSGRSGLVGDGVGTSRILSTSNGFTIAPGLQFVTLRGFTLAADPRYTITTNALVGIDIQGTTASQVYFSRFDDLLIDGFELAIKADGVCQTSFTRIDTEYCHRGLVSFGQTLNNNIVGCWFAGEVGTSTRGIAIGDGVDSNEGWMISDTLVYGHSRNIAAFGSVALKVNNCILDFGTEFGVLLQSSGPVPCVLCSITSSYIAMHGTADSGIFCANSVAAVTGQTGHRIAGNNILVYSGSTLTNGILVDGTHDVDHTIDGNTILASTLDLNVADTAVRMTVINNHAYGPGYFFESGANPIFENNRGTVVGGTIPTVASAAALTLPAGPKKYIISGTTNITSIVATGHTGDTVTLLFLDVLTFTDGNNLKLAGNFVTSADDTITLFCDGTNFYEICRSAN